ncbi:hypothetical protein GCM10017764_23550 [Sphingobacterium griseoflavum]|uniref:FAS1 domain-containing protein n=2 Tax=Sphingobacterium griseoflavum TaxID=1474952 RepID=A0ABQ3HZD9_9SPHI|nr:hypothetical protein GCM10017764_23550 [Sphingobacterium griseoflavum]
MGGCEIQEDFSYQPSGVDGKLGVSAWEYVQRNDSLSILREAITYAGLQDLYSGTDARTFVMPNNRALRTYLRENAYAGVQDVPLPILRNLLRYHVVNARVIFTDPDLMPANRPIAYPTANGQVMYLSHTSTFIGLINEGTSVQWQITTSNLEPTNGVIHVVNAVVYYAVPTGDTNAPNPDLVQDTIYPIADAFVNGGFESDLNFGSNPLLRVKHITGSGDYDRKAFLMFNLDDFSKDGVVTDMKLQLAVSFTHAKGVPLDLYETPSTTWTEAGLKFSNAVFPQGSPLARIITSKVSTFNFDITDYYKARNAAGRVSFMLEGAAGADETNDIASKEHPTLNPPMLIATLASGLSNLEIVTQNDITVSSGGVFVFSEELLKIDGAAASDIIYTIEQVPQSGWLIRGASTLRAGARFTQADIDLNNLLFIHDGEQAGTDRLVLSARDRAGALLEDIQINIYAQ